MDLYYQHPEMDFFASPHSVILFGSMPQLAVTMAFGRTCLILRDNSTGEKPAD